MPSFEIPAAPERYNIWVKPDHQDRRHVVAAIAALLGLDPRRARKLLESGSPICRKVRCGEAEYLRDRFAVWGLGVRVEPDLPERSSEPSEQILLGRPIRMAAVEPFGCLQAFLGLALAGLTAFVLLGIDPFGVTAFELPQGLDHAG